MKKVLLSYRSSRIRQEIEEQIVKFKGSDIHLIVENEANKFHMRYLLDETVNLYTNDELINGELDHMKGKFNYIAGNPPYQHGTNKAKSQKLYIDITEKVIPLLASDGEINFITPQAILDPGQGNSVYDLLSKNLESVDYDADKNFNIGQNVISWLYKNNSTQSHINVVDGGNIRKVDEINGVCRLQNELPNSILNKLSFKNNGKKKCCLAKADKRFGIKNKHLYLEKDVDSGVTEEVYCNTKKQRIKFCEKKFIVNEYTQLILPYSEVWSTDMIKISDEPTNEFFMVNMDERSSTILENMMEYFKSPLISYSVVMYNKIIKPSANNNFLFRVSEIDFTRQYSNDELYVEFNITSGEQKVIEDWYQEWKK